MKFRITFKDPDGCYDGLQEAVKQSIESVDGLAEGEAELLEEGRTEKLRKFLSRWLEYGEYVTLEFDTEAGTAKVVERH